MRLWPGRGGSADKSQASAQSADSGPDAAHGPGKGRPTPTRKEAEAARRTALKVPTDPKEAKKAAKARAAAERNASRAALIAGDEKGLPARDAGPVKAFVRDFVDSRFCAAEMFLPSAVVVLVLGFIRNPVVQSWATMGWLVFMLFMIMDTTILMNRLSRQLKKGWPSQAERKGAMWYASLRVIQIRRLRLPPPRFRAGGRPVTPKVKKQKG